MGSIMTEAFKKAGYAGREEKQQVQSRKNENIKSKDIEYKVVEDAEETIKLLRYKDKNGNPKITTSQIRKFLTAVNVVRNKVDLWKVNNKGNKKLPGYLVMEIKFLKVNLLYQAGRDKGDIVEDFVEKAKLKAIIDGIGSDLDKFNKFCKYVEALVAYHKYYGGKDK